jgi:bacteriocin-like protein
MKNTKSNETRVFARKVASKLNKEEMKKVTGGTNGISKPWIPIEERPTENHH